MKLKILNQKLLFRSASWRRETRFLPKERFLYCYVAILLITILGAFLRFYNLNWDQGYFFHPDESNNIIHPAANLQFPFKPEQFTYGSLTIYLYRLVASTIAFLTQNPSWIKAEQIALIGRFISAGLSTLMILLIFFLGKKFFSSKVGLLAALLTTVNAGLIQAAHFGTTETILTLGGLLIILATSMILKSKNYRQGYLLGAVSLGLTVGAKISSLIFFLPFLLSHLLALKKKNFVTRNLVFLLNCLLMLLVFLFVSPYSLLAFPAFKESFFFEKNIATGQLPIFFTGQFYETQPYFFQITKILPWILGWPILILGFLGLIIVFSQSLKEHNKEKLLLFFLPVFYFLYNGSLFAKWTRYMVPLIPFLCLFAAFALIRILEKSQKQKILVVLANVFIGIILMAQIFYGLAFFNIYRQPQTRIAASQWIYQNLPSGSRLLLEPLDVVALPLTIKDKEPASYQQVWFDFYGLDEVEASKKPGLIQELVNKIAGSDYIIIGSRRLYANRLRLKDKYPLAANYYTLLFNGQLGFDKIKEFSSYPKILNIEINDDQAEETFQVFDHPKVLIFQNQKHLFVNDLTKILNQ